MIDRLFRTLDPPAVSYWSTRFLLLRCLGIVYSIAFLSLASQLNPLLGSGGLLPVHLFLDSVESAYGTGPAALWNVPTIFWVGDSDAFMSVAAWLGLCLSLLLLSGYASALHLLALWILYSSFVNVGQIFYSYGWEIMLLETGFLAVFLCPLVRGGWRSSLTAPPEKSVIWLLRWLLFRVMFGAGLIKLRGDACWWDLTCLLYHYETQPIPNPISWYLHQCPVWLHKLGALFNHFVELIAPWLILRSRRLRYAGGLFIVGFQILLIVSGNLSWLNYLTLVLCIPCFDDRALLRLLPERLRSRLAIDTDAVASVSTPRPLPRRLASYTLVGVVLYLSIDPVVNMVSSRQIMNTSFDRLHLVNTYGAFGSVGKIRREVVIRGTMARTADTAAEWREYEFKCKPGNPHRRPCVVSPYHHRLDWQIWFAAMSDYQRQPWLIHLVYKLLLADEGALGLLGGNPFPGDRPTHIRADLYEYEFTDFDDITGAWWKRRRVGTYLPPVSADNAALLRIVERFGWPAAPAYASPRSS